jgi:hypothetical protein
MASGWSRARALSVTGLVLMVIGAIDPLEGSIAILAGCAAGFAGAAMARSPHSRIMLRAMVLMAAGISVMIGFSVMGGIGGDTGRPVWWAVAILPYPAGWILGIVGSVKVLRGRAVVPGGVRAAQQG